jgi:hypothetical protein
MTHITHIKVILVFLILVSSQLLFASSTPDTTFPADMPFNPQNKASINFNKVIRIGRVTNYTIAGIADLRKLRDYAAKKGINIKAAGFPFKDKAGMALSFAFWSDVEGCGCPSEFAEFGLAYEVENAGAGTTQATPDFVVSSHDARVNSLHTKFGTRTRKGTVTKNDFQFIVRADDGTVAVTVDAKGGFPDNFSEQRRSDYGIHSMGGEVGGVSLVQKFYRIFGISNYAHSIATPPVGGVNLFDLRNKIRVSKDSALGKHLKEVGFEAIQWRVYDTKNAWAWLP